MPRDESKVTPEEMLSYVLDSLKDLTSKLEEYLESEEEKKSPSQMSPSEYAAWRKRGGGK